MNAIRSLDDPSSDDQVAGRCEAPPPARGRVRSRVRPLPGGLVLGHPRAPRAAWGARRVPSMGATARDVPRRARALIVSSFVLPQVGGVEQFVDVAARLLRGEGWRVRVLACRPRMGDAQADVTVPTRFLGAGGWPLPVGGWRAALAGGRRRRRRRRERDAPPAPEPRGLRGAPARKARALRPARLRRAVLDELVLLPPRARLGCSSGWSSRPALRLSQPVSLSRAGRRRARAAATGSAATYVPFPLRELPPATRPTLGPDEPLRIVWVGRLYREKNPLARGRAASSECGSSGPRRSTSTATARCWTSSRSSRGSGRGSPCAGPRSWEEIQQVQGTAHVCLSTSLRDATQIAILEPLARGVPVVSTRVGDAPGYYARGPRSFCVDPRRPGGRGWGDPRARGLVRRATASASRRTRTSWCGATAREHGAWPRCSSRRLGAATARPAGRAERSFQ